MKIKKLFLISFFSLLIFGNSSYAEGPLQIKTRAWPTKITLGDEIKLTIQIESPKGFSIIPLSIKTSAAPFEIKRIEDLSYSETEHIIRQAFQLKLTTFQLGKLQIPPISINFTDPGGRQGQEWTEPVLVEVKSVIKDKEAKEKKEIRPIKGPVALDISIVRMLIFSVLSALLTLGLAVKIFLRRRNRKFIDPESLKPPDERAMLELERLNAKSYLSEGKVKEHYSELADILRRYLERRFEMEALELTTFEILKNIIDKQFSILLIEKIKDLLESSDLVKFAKFIPPRSLADRLSAVLCAIVEETKPEPPKPEARKK